MSSSDYDLEKTFKESRDPTFEENFRVGQASVMPRTNQNYSTPQDKYVGGKALIKFFRTSNPLGLKAKGLNNER